MRTSRVITVFGNDDCQPKFLLSMNEIRTVEWSYNGEWEVNFVEFKLSQFHILDVLPSEQRHWSF